jgi:hypothetical protein
MAQMRIDKLRSAVEAAGVTMAPASDQFDPEPETVELDAGNYSRSWATPRYKTTFDKTAARPNKLKDWFAVRWPRALSTG